MLHTTALRRVLLISLLILLSIGQALELSAGNNVWTSNGPEGGTVLALAIDPSDASHPLCGVGTWWRRVQKHERRRELERGQHRPDQYSVYALAIDPATPTTLYAGTGGVFKSTNGGGNWSAVNTGLPAYTMFMPWRLTRRRRPPSMPGYAMEWGGGVFKSTNGGGNWSAVRHRAAAYTTATHVYALAIDPATPTTLYAGTVAACSRARTAAGTGARSTPASLPISRLCPGD